MAEKKGAGGKPQEFDEESGRYGSNGGAAAEQLRTGGAKEYRQNTSYTEILSKDRKESLNNPNPPQSAYGFEDKKKKNSPDHIQHAKEFGFKNQDEYEKAAIDFWNKGDGETFYGSKRGRFAKYNEKTSEYAVIDANGTLRTYYRIPSKKFKKIKKQEGFEEWKK